VPLHELELPVDVGAARQEQQARAPAVGVRVAAAEEQVPPDDPLGERHVIARVGPPDVGGGRHVHLPEPVVAVEQVVAGVAPSDEGAVPVAAHHLRGDPFAVGLAGGGSPAELAGPGAAGLPEPVDVLLQAADHQVAAIALEVGGVGVAADGSALVDVAEQGLARLDLAPGPGGRVPHPVAGGGGAGAGAFDLGVGDVVAEPERLGAVLVALAGPGGGQGFDACWQLVGRVTGEGGRGLLDQHGVGTSGLEGRVRRRGVVGGAPGERGGEGVVGAAADAEETQAVGGQAEVDDVLAAPCVRCAGDADRPQQVAQPVGRGAQEREAQVGIARGAGDQALDVGEVDHVRCSGGGHRWCRSGASAMAASSVAVQPGATE
jgi:hypothetical protein